MNRAGEIISITPKYALPLSEIVIDCKDFTLDEGGDHAVLFGDYKGRIVAASKSRIIVEVPKTLDTVETWVRLESGGDRSEPVQIRVAWEFIDDMHMVGNPAIDPSDDSMIVTRSGSRGQHISVSLFRLDHEGFVSDITADVMNPTGLAFGPDGELYVTNRNDGTVCRIERDEEAVVVASGLGIATGIAFDENGTMFVGDRGGTIYRIGELGTPEVFATLEPSVAAYHMAFGPDGRLYVTSPGLSSFDCVYAIDRAGFETRYFRGLGRPQGLAFDAEGNLYVAACYEGRRGIVKIGPGGENAEMFLSGNAVVGLCFNREGDVRIATNSHVYTLPIKLSGALPI